MASASWKTAQSGDWSAAADWSTNTVPTAADDVTIAVGGSYTVTVSVPEAAKTLSLTDSGAVLQVSAGLSVGGGFTAAGGTIAVSSGQTLSLAGAVTFGVNGSTGPTVSGPGTVLTSGATSITAQTGGNYPDLFIGNGATWVNTGTVTDAGLIYFGTTSNDTVTLTNRAGGVFNLTSSNATFNTQYSNVGATFNNAGLLEKTAGTGNSNFIAALNNTGTVKVDQASTLTLANNFTDAGSIVLAGGVLAAPTLTLAAGATLSGFGTLSAAVVDNGVIDAAGGDLVLTKAPTGTGIERIEAASTLELTAASAGAATFNGLGARLRIDVANSYTGTLTNVAAGDGLILQGVTATGATTSGTALTVNLAGGGTEKFTLSAPLTAIREGVTADGSGNSSVVFYRYAAPAAVTPIAFTNHHVGDVATMAVPVTNTAAADGYSEVLDAMVGSANAAITVAGSVSLLGAGQTSANGLSVTLLTTTGGAKTGTATVGFSTDGAGVDGDPALTLAGQTLNVSGNFVTGTLIRTPGGDRPVETMAIGDMVELADGGRAPVRWIGRRSYAGRFLAGQPAAVPVRIRAGALGPLLPERDLLVSPKHAMLVDGVLVAAELLVDGETVVRERGLSRVDYHHIELDRHAIILAEGAATESFVDDDSRNMFHNAHEYRELYGEHSVAATYCAPRVESGLELEAIRRRLASHRNRVGRARAA